MNELQSNGAFAHRVRALASQVKHEPIAAVSFATAVALLLWFSVPVLESLNSIWLIDTDYTHGYLILALIAALAFFEIQQRPLAAMVPSWLGVLCLIALVLVVIGALAATTEVVAQLALPVLWVSVIWALAGARNARRFVAPLSYLFFAVPIWNLLIDPMRELTIRVVSVWTRSAGMPAFIEGNLIHVPTGTFEVQGGCAGLRYLLVAAALTVFTCLLHRRRFLPAALFIVCAAVLALVGNWVRVFATVAAGLSPEQPMAVFVHNNHTLFGWLLFIVFMVPVFYLDRVLESGGTTESTRQPGPDLQGSGARRNTVAYVSCAVLALGMWLGFRVAGGEVERPLRALSLPVEIAGWGRTVEWQDRRLPVFIGPSQQIAAWYGDGAFEIGVYLANYASQRQEHEVVFFHNRPAGASAAVVARRSVGESAAPGVAAFRELEVLDSEDQRRLVWVGLRVSGEPTENDFVAKARQVVGAIRGRRDAQALVFTARCATDCGEARSQLSKFAASAATLLYAQADEVVGALPTSGDARRGLTP